MKHFFLTLFFLSLAMASQGQVFHNVEAVGECEKKEGVDAERVALVRAKEAALNEVLGQTISSSTVYRIRDDKEEFYKNTHVQRTGVVFVLDQEIVDTKKKVTVTIHADVVSAKMPKTLDVETVCQKNGKNDYLLKCRQYTENDKLEFNIKSYGRNCINVFWFDEDTYEGGLLFSCVMTEGQERSYGEYGFWKRIFPELLTKDEREAIWFKEHRYIKETPRTGGTKHLKIMFVATPDKLAPANSIKNELDFEKWWCEVPQNQRQLPVIEHITFLM